MSGIVLVIFLMVGWVGSRRTRPRKILSEMDSVNVGGEMVASACDEACKEFTQFDKNADGFVDQQESGSEELAWLHTLATYDADHDRLISMSEFEKLMKAEEDEKKAELKGKDILEKMRSTAAKAISAEIVNDEHTVPSDPGSASQPEESLLDENGELHLTSGHFAKIDRNSDSLVDQDEALLHGGTQEEWSRTLEKYDSDGDNMLSQSEFTLLLGDWRTSRDEYAVTNESHQSRAQPGCQEEMMETGPQVSKADMDAQLSLRQQHIQSVTDTAGLAFGSEFEHTRLQTLQKLFQDTDADSDGRLSQLEYRKVGSPSRFSPIQGPFREAIDLDTDGKFSDVESSAAASFEFVLLDADSDGFVTLDELGHSYASRGWLRASKFRPAVALAVDRALPSLTSALLELTWGEEFYQESSPATVDHGKRTDWLVPDGYQGEPNSSLVTLGDSGRRRRKMNKEESDETMTEIVSQVLETITEILGTEFCWRKIYDRGAGRPASCKTGWEKWGAMCYKKCVHPRFRAWHDMEYCAKPCHKGSTDIGLFCRTNGLTTTKWCCGNCWPGWCCLTWCCGGCPSGYTNTGCFCEPSWKAQDRQYSPGKTMYATSVLGCGGWSPDGVKQTPIGGFCYPKPWSGYSCDLTSCRQKCPPTMVACGLGACALTSSSCAGSIVTSVVAVAQAVFDTALLVASFGTTGAGANQAKRVAVKKATQKSFRAAAKANIKKFAKRLVKSDVKKYVKDAVMKKLTKKAMKKAMKDFIEEKGQEAVDNAVNVAINEFASKGENSFDNFDYTVMDPTGIASAVKTSVDGEDALTQAKAYTEVVGTFDPTGWVSAAASFMHPTCDH